MKYLLAEGLMDGSCITVTGRTLAENLEGVPGLKEGQKIVRPLNDPIKPTGHIQILWGNLAPEGSVAKITGKEGSSSPVQRVVMTVKKRCWLHWNAKRFKKAT